MDNFCDLEVDVNGEEIFKVNKKILASFSGRFCRLFHKSTDSKRQLKVIFHDFPGGADGFELIARFCYNNGTIQITGSNIVLLNSAAHFMQMDSNSSATLNLIAQVEKSLEGIIYWTWSELVVALRQCQDLRPAANSSFLLQKVLDYLIGKLALPSEANPFMHILDDFSTQFSYDTSSSSSTRSNFHPTTWWFEDLLFLKDGLFEKVIRMMVSKKLDHAVILKFLIFYLKSHIITDTIAGKRKIAEIAINLLSLFDRNRLSCKALFEVLRVVSILKLSRCHRAKLETLIGWQLDQATLSHLLVPSPRRNCYMYDVNLVLRLVKEFLVAGENSSSQLRKVASLMDSYLMEVAPDVLLRPPKFAALLLILPSSARESNDRIYEAIDIYLEVHSQLGEEEKMVICAAMNHEKLPAEALEHLAKNSKFPLGRTVEAFITQHSKLIHFGHSHLPLVKTVKDSTFCRIGKKNVRTEKARNGEQITQYC